MPAAPRGISGATFASAAEHAELLGLDAVFGRITNRCEAEAEQFPDRGRPTRHALLKAPIIDRAQFIIVEHDLQSALAGSLNHRTALPAHL
jgi:hypothetical protein